MDAALRTTESADPFRPIQYLGSKLRSCGQILDQLERVHPAGGMVLDLFTGSTVVAQSIAKRGIPVAATDAMRFCTVMARAVLGIGRGHAARGAISIASALSVAEFAAGLEAIWADWSDRETRAIERRDGGQLLRLCQDLPQVWRPHGATAAIERLFNRMRSREGQRIDFPGIFASHYAGTYFGITQAIHIDGIRMAIEHAYRRSKLSRWEYDISLAALCSTISDCVFSAGKHFAQPQLARAGKDLAFLKSRMLTDRTIDVAQRFRDRLCQCHQASHTGLDHHVVKHCSMERLLETQRGLPPIATVYADPPYTAEQYSRFYHVPEVLVEYRVPELQRVNGQVTRGLYPSDRFKSRFCSRQQCGQAFGDLLSLVRMRGANLILSYSASTSGVTGNDRMFSLDALRQLCRQHYASVEIVQLEHAYRQFNRKPAAVRAQKDREFILVCERLIRRDASRVVEREVSSEPERKDEP